MRWEEITTALELIPSHRSNAGEPRVNLAGTPLGGICKNTYWNCRLAEGNADGLIQALAANVSRLEAHRDFLDEFSVCGGSMEYDVAWFLTKAVSAECLPWELIARIADLKIDLAFDIYGRR
jgi:hypothetical protein